MATTPVSSKDKLTQEHALYILRALQEIQTQVTFNVGEIASRRGAKENTVYKMFKHLKKTYGLNIAITSAGYRGGNSATPQRQRLIEDTTSATPVTWSQEEETPRAGKSSTVKKSTPFRKETSKKREYSSSDWEDDTESQSSPSKKRFFYPVWTSEEELGEGVEETAVTDDTESH